MSVGSDGALSPVATRTGISGRTHRLTTCFPSRPSNAGEKRGSDNAPGATVGEAGQNQHCVPASRSRPLTARWSEAEARQALLLHHEHVDMDDRQLPVAVRLRHQNAPPCRILSLRLTP